MHPVPHKFGDLSGKRQALLELAAREARAAGPSKIKPRANKQEAPLSYAQRGLWFLCQLAPDQGFYNLPSAVRLEGPLNVEAMRQTFRELVRRHEALRTTFPTREGRPVQHIAPTLDLDMPLHAMPDLPRPEREQAQLAAATRDSLEPFDLAAGPLIRAAIYQIDDEDHVLLFNIHHIVVDGWSIGVLNMEIPFLYGAYAEGRRPELPPLPVQFADYAVWERDRLQGQRLAELLAWWRERLAGVEPLALATDRPRPRVQTFTGARQYLGCDAALTAELESLSERRGATLFQTLLAGFQLLLSRYTGQDDITVGAPAANRAHREIEGLVGFFVNTLALRADLAGAPSFAALLDRVKTAALGAYQHGEAPFEMLVEKLNVTRDPSRNPIFQVMFSLQKSSVDELALPGLKARQEKLANDTTHFDIELHLWNREGQIGGYFSYNKDLFEPATILRMAGHYGALLRAAATEPDLAIDRLSMLTPQERAFLTSRGQAPVAGDQTPLAMFEGQVRRQPRAPAVVAADGSVALDYGELAHAAKALARRLRALLGGDRRRVGVVMAPGAPRAVAVMATLMAGAAATPVEKRPKPDAPSPVDLLLVDHEDAAKPFEDWNAMTASVRLADLTAAATTALAETDPRAPALASRGGGTPHLATAAEVGARIDRLQAHFQLNADHAVLCHASFDDDFFAMEAWWALAAGARLTCPKAGASKGGWDWAASFAAATHARFHPEGLARMLEALADERINAAERTRHALCGAGLLSRELARDFIRQTGASLTYAYSPPEAGAELSFAPCDGTEERALIDAGKSFAAPITVTDTAGRLTPVGVPGEIRVNGLAVGDRGRWLGDGTLALEPAGGRLQLREGKRYDLAEIEAALSSHASVIECCARVTDRGEIAAYAVVKGAPAPDRLRAHAATRLPQPMRPVAIIPVSRLPVTAGGRLDHRALDGVETIDEDLTRRWESALRNVSGVDRLAVLACEEARAVARLHLSELAPPDPRRRGGAGGRAPLAALEAGRAFAADLPPAFADGGELTIPAEAPRTLTEAFLATAARYPERGLTLIQDTRRFLSYAALAARAKRMLAGLRARGLRAGDRVILQVEDLADHFSAFWACALGGVIPVTVAISPGYSRKTSVLNKLWNVWLLLKRPALLASKRLADELAGLPSLYDEAEGAFAVHAVEALADHDEATALHRPEPEDVLFYQLTSGSTGVPKCIQETHRGVVRHLWGSMRFNGYTADDTTLNWLPMDHVVPILTCHLKDAYLGIRQIVASPGAVLADPLVWLDLIEEHRVTHTWAPNFGFKLVSDALAKNPGHRRDLSSLRFAMNAGEQVTEAVTAEFLARTAPFGVRPEVMQPAFGMAETCTCITYANDFSPARSVHRIAKRSLGGVLEPAAAGEDSVSFVDLGPPMPGVQIRIADSDRQTLPEGVIGRFQIRGGVTTPGYLDNEAANADAFVGDGWFNSGDLGFIKNGRLTLTGREKEMIIIRGANFYCYEIEDVVNGVAGTTPTFSAVCAVEDPDSGSEGLAVFYVPASGKADIDGALIQKIRETIARDAGISPSHVIPLARADFPKTTSGKIQRARLKQSLHEGRFEETLKRVDLALANERTAPPWFHRIVWRRKQPPERRLSSPPAGVLIFADSHGLGESLAAEIGGQSCVLVEAGRMFTALGPRHYALDPGAGDDYEALFTALAAAGPIPELIVHLWSCDTDGNGDRRRRDAVLESGLYSVLALGRCLARRGLGGALLVAARQAVAAEPTPRVVAEKAALIGLIRALADECPGLACRIVDLGEPGDADASRLSLETRLTGGDRVAAWRGTRRLVPGLAPIPLKPADNDAFKEGGLYLVSGGLGGVGVVLARWLLRRYRARLVLLGRTPLDEDSDRGRERAAAFESLTGLDGETVYEALDICDEAALRAAVERAESKFSSALDGVIHLAGSFASRLVSEEARPRFEQIMAPKLAGSRALAAVTPKGVLFLAFGSVNAFFGGVAAGAYAAANSCLAGFCAELRARGVNARCLAWTMWDEVGMSRGYPMKEASRAQGFHLIDKTRGLASLPIALGLDEPDPLIGLDAANPNIGRFLDDGPLARLRLTAFYTAAPGHGEPDVHALEVCDRFGAPSRLRFTRLREMPMTAAGDIDAAALRALGDGGRAKAPRVAPRNNLERMIAQTWRETLGVEEVGIHNSFFELGGQSVLLVQVHSKLRQLLNRELTVIELLRYPTINALAKHLSKGQKQKPAYQAAVERAARQKRARARRPKPLRRRKP